MTNKIDIPIPLGIEPETIPANVQLALDLGYQHAARATTAQDATTLVHEMQQAVSHLKPISTPEFHVPKASFGLGLLAEHMAKLMLVNPDLPEEQQLGFAFQYFQKASEYYEIAASMPDYQWDFTPARARNSLAELYFLGCLGEKDEVKALELWESAAQSGFAEAQINMAVRCYRGEGIEKSLPLAYLWLQEAHNNNWQLSRELQHEVRSMMSAITTELKKSTTLLRNEHRPKKLQL